MASDNQYRLDKNAFKTRSFEEADNYMRDYRNYNWKERLKIALYLTSLAYNFDINNPPRLDRTGFTMNKRT